MGGVVVVVMVVLVVLVVVVVGWAQETNPPIHGRKARRGGPEGAFGNRALPPPWFLRLERTPVAPPQCLSIDQAILRDRRGIRYLHLPFSCNFTVATVRQRAG